MNLYFVLLKAVNVGGKNLLPMKDLKVVLNGAGFENVETYIQSGNIVLESSVYPEEEIAKLILSNFKFKPDLVVLSEEEFDEIVSNNPYRGHEGKFVHFYFCKEVPKIDAEKLATLASQTERYQQIGNVFYLHAPDGIGRSKLVAGLESCLGVPATGRNLNTVQKLSSMKKHA